MIPKRYFFQTDWLLLAIAIALAMTGVANIYSATHVHQPFLYKKQIYWLVVALVVMVPVVIVNYSLFERFAYVIYGISIVTLVVALLWGHSAGGSRRWLDLGLFNFQPSELAKIAFLMALAKYLSSRELPRRGLGLKELAGPVALVALPFTLIAKQPDLGTALIFLFVFVSMLCMVKIRLRTVLTISAAILSMVPFVWHSLKDYQKARLLSFLDPTMDPLGSGYHILQSKIAIGSGGFLGKGFAQGTQGTLMFLPAHHTDFIFPVLAEEWGFVGSFVVLLLFLFFIIRAMDITGGAKDRFGFLLAFGIISMVFWHTVVNMGMVTGLLPVVGVPLPFLSYGGSFLVTTFIGVGLLLNIAIRRFLF